MKFQNSLLILLIIFISVYSLSYNTEVNLRKIFTAAVANIKINTIRDWSLRGGFARDLTTGDSGQDVLWLQTALKTDKNIYPEGIVTGVFGNLTQKALLKFQEQYNLPMTAIFDNKTRLTLNELFLYELCPKSQDEYSEVSITKIVNKNTPLPKKYVPTNLQKLPEYIPKTSSVICLKKTVIPFLETMLTDSKKANANITISSGFRSIRNQEYLFNHWKKVLGKSSAEKLSAPPGSSEHQLGTTIDLTTNKRNYGLNTAFAQTTEGIWMLNNAYKYGFIMSYPKNKENITGYSYEPWHWRFVGIGTATILKNKDKTLTEIKIPTNITTYSKPNSINLPALQINLR